MSGSGIGELIWLVIAVLLGLGVVIAWIVKSEASRNLLRDEMQKLKSQLASIECEKSIMIEEMNASGTSGSSGRAEELEKDNTRLKQELAEARSSLEEVYKALCNK